MALGFGAFWLTPIGFDRLYPVGGARRRWFSGLLLSGFGLGSFGLLLGIIFLGV